LDGAIKSHAIFFRIAARRRAGGRDGGGGKRGSNKDAKAVRTEEDLIGLRNSLQLFYKVNNRENVQANKKSVVDGWFTDKLHGTSLSEKDVGRTNAVTGERK